MNDNSIIELFQMMNGFSREGVIPRFSNDVIQKCNALFQTTSALIVASIIVEAYTKLRDRRIFDVWYTVTVEQAGMRFTVLCQLYLNRIFEVWVIQAES